MPSTYTSSLRLTLPATGELSGSWGNTVNTGITTLTDNAIAGYTTVTMTDADYTLTTANGATDEARSMMLNITGTLTAARNVICPTASKLYIIKNATTGGFAITLKTSGGTGISIPNGKSMLLMCDGTNVVDAVTNFSSLTLGSPLLPASGGTGLTALGTGVATWLGTPSSANLAAAVTDETGSDALVFATSPTLVTPALGTPSSAVLTNATGSPISTGVSGLGTGIATFLGTPSSANLAAAVTDETGSGSLVFGTSPTLSSPTITGTGTAAFGNLSYTGTLTGGTGVVNLGSGQFYKDASGNVGIGTSSPGLKLDVAGGGNSVRIRTDGSAIGRLQFTDSGVTTDYAYIGTPAVNSLAFYTNGLTERMRLDASGNLGIGTSSPGNLLDVASTATANQARIGTKSGTAANDAAVIIRNVSSATAATRLARIYLDANGGDGVGGDYFNIKAYGDGSAVLMNESNSYTAFGTNGTEKMRLDSSGNLGLGVTPSSWGSGIKAFDFGIGSALVNTGSTTTTWLASNAYNNGTNWIYKNTALASYYQQAAGVHTWFTAPSGTAGNAITFTQAMTLDAAGNLGLGVTPSAWVSNRRVLQIGGASAAGIALNGTAAVAELFANTTRDAGGTYRYFATGPASYVDFNNSNAGGWAWSIAPSGTAGTAITFTQAMMLSAAGNLGLGTVTSPAFLIDATAPSSGDTTIRLTKNGSVNTTINAVTGALTFGIDGSGGTTERVRIDSSGNLLVGTTTALAANYRFQVTAPSSCSVFQVTQAAAYPTALWSTATAGDNLFAGFFTEGGTGTLRGSIDYNRAGGLTRYNTTSDYRAKDIIGPVQDSGATIDALKVYEGVMKGATQSRPMLIAHEAQEHAPYAVSGVKDEVNEDGSPKYQQMDVSSLVPLLIAEIQSLRARVASLEAKP